MLHKKFFLYAVCLILLSCNNDFEKNQSHQQIPDANIKKGKKLAAQYCASCHLLPEPSLLDSKSWENGVLPEMGPRLGIFYYGSKEYPSYKNDLNVDRNFYPSKPVLSLQDWQSIIEYYTATSPDSLPPAKKPVAIKMNDKLFQPIRPERIYNMPATSFVRIEPEGKLVTCDAFSKKLYVFNSSVQLTDSINTKSSVTDVIQDSGKLILCNTGLLSPNNGKYGSIISLKPGDTPGVDTVFKNLMRPVQIARYDINKDGRLDYVVCEFGNLAGALSWLENKGNNQYEYHLLHAAPGVINVHINDFNKDGLPDIWALFSQGDESIFLFTNKGKNIFEAKQVLWFPASYGSSSFELDDLNNDGFQDIIYTCGDNADYSVILKPYHGVYIFLNDGENNFTQKYFYPIDGCYKAIARDFDKDGDLDIATISFFADYARQPEEGFVYFKNEGDFKFQPFSLTAAQYGHWLTMDANDFDGDGKIDLMLGNFSARGTFTKSAIDWTKQPPFLILKNLQ